MYKEVNVCRICGNTKFEPIVSLGVQSLTGVFPKSIDDKVDKGPLDLVQCKGDNSCGLVQLKHSFSHEEMYGMNYGYRSGLNKSMVMHLSSITKKVSQIIELKDNDVIIDIGSNDSTLLQSYAQVTKAKLNLIGIDPTGIKFKKYYPENINLIADFFSANIFKKAYPNKKAKVVSSIAMFYDLEDPTSFMEDIYNVLSDDGIWIFEQSYLLTMLEVNAYDTICHEHIEYYAIRQIEWMAKKVGFKLVDIILNDINGGSFQIICTKAINNNIKSSSNLDKLIINENDNLHKLLINYKIQVENHRNELIKLLTKLKTEGKKVFGYGASTKGNVILQYCGIDKNLMPYIAEVNEDKFGSFTPGTLIPIISENEARALKPDYFLVLPWHFRAGILEREKEFLKNGGKFIFPLPKIEIV
ncbi:MAG: class I SAM-dependent methyltransferase [Bacteroidota bacterium]|nr:class I SAM-dependent methyltransferase [Bacteroidota bacterium]